MRKLFAFAILFLICCGCTSTRRADLSEFLDKSRHMRSGEIQWEAVVQMDFENADASANCPIAAGEWEVRDGQLWAIAGETDRAILLARSGLDPVRVDFEATCYAQEDGRIGDITVLLNTKPGERCFFEGYSPTTGAYWNHGSIIYRSGVPLARTEHPRLVSGKRYRVRVELTRGHIRYWLDDEIILEAWDPAPLRMDSARWIGIRTWGTLMSVDNVTIYRGGTERK